MANGDTIYPNDNPNHSQFNPIKMKVKKFDYSESTEDIFYKIIYPMFPREFLFGNDYEKFAFIVSANFILNPPQWQYILEHWEQKESILKIETHL
jgi:hypothetical protein